jgi:hypothetical protein
MTKTYEYKGHTITFNEVSADFSVKINGRNVRSTSLEGAKRQVEKYAVAEFKPVDVLVVDYDKKHNKILKQVTLEKYEENRPYGTRDLERFVVTSEGKRLTIGGWRSKGKVFPLSSRAKVEALIKEETEQKAIREKAADRCREIERALNDATFDLYTIDPKSSKS